MDNAVKTKLKFGSEVGTGYLHQIHLGERMRKELEDKEQTLDDLLYSIQHEHHGTGLIEPLVVERLATPIEGKIYGLLCGGRRLTALLNAGIDDEIPLRIYPPLTERDRQRIEIYENTRRKSFSWAEDVKAKADLHAFMTEEYGERVAARTSSNDPTIVGWAKTDTANVLGETPTNLNRDLTLAAAIKLVPELAQLKNKAEAAQLMKKLNRVAETEDRLREIEAFRASRSEDAWLHQLEQSYLVGDFFTGCANLPDESLDFIEVDPPYAIQEFAPRFTDEGLHGSRFVDWTAENYLENIRRTARECYRLLRPDSWMICWFAQHPHGPATYDALIEAGFAGMRLPAVWAKPQYIHPTTNLKCYLGRTHEAFYYLRKGQPEVQKPGRPDVFLFDTVSAGDKTNSCEKPVALYEEILATFLPPGKTLMTAFAGSGNMLLAAHNQKHNCFGFDNSQQGKDEFVVKLHSGEWRRE